MKPQILTPEMADRKPFERRFNSTKNGATNQIAKWMDFRDYLLPTHGRFNGERPNSGRRVDHTKLLDGAAARAIDDTTIGLSSHLTNPAQPWLALTLRDKDLARYAPVKWWLGEAADRLLTVFADSNTYPYLSSLYKELLAFNNCAGITEFDPQSSIISRWFTIGEYYFGIGADGRVDTFAREYDTTVGQLVQAFGKQNVSQAVARCYDKQDFDTMFKCRHVIMPNVDRDPRRADSKNMPVASLYWEPGAPEGKILRKSGYLEFPVQAGRFDVVSGDFYGEGQASDTIGDAKELQKIVREYLEALERVNRPPTQGPADAETDLVPGGYTPTSDTTPEAGLRTVYQINPNLAEMRQRINDKKEDIARGFYADRFRALDAIERGMTAREVYERTMENMRSVGPLVVKIQNEILDPLVRRTFNILLRAQLLPPIPPELAGQQINIEYVSLMAQAQKATRTSSLQEHLLFVGDLSKIDPAVVDVVDADFAARWHGETLSIPTGVDRDPAAVQKMRAQRQAEKEQAAKIQHAGALVAGAKTLADTKLGQGSALDAIVNPGGAAGAGGAGSPGQ